MHHSFTPRRQSGSMVRAHRYLHKRCGRRRSGERYYLRVPVPADLRAVFGRLIERPLRTSDPRVARIRRDAILPEVRAMFDRARTEPKLENVLRAVRREEMVRAHIEWAELIADRGLAAAASCQHHGRGCRRQPLLAEAGTTDRLTLRLEA
jgi:hypothetical protein